jgi:hypothetical protein
MWTGVEERYVYAYYNTEAAAAVQFLQALKSIHKQQELTEHHRNNQQPRKALRHLASCAATHMCRHGKANAYPKQLQVAAAGAVYTTTQRSQQQCC